MMSLAPDIGKIRRENGALFAAQPRYLRRLALAAAAILLYYLYFFEFYGIEWSRAALGAQQLGRYFLRMFVWHDFVNWPFGYYFSQIGITLAIVFAGTLTASLIALPLSFFRRAQRDARPRHAAHRLGGASPARSAARHRYGDMGADFLCAPSAWGRWRACWRL
ncbi:hypothetical protein OJE16_11940 [Pantoea tagorei]